MKKGIIALMVMACLGLGVVNVYLRFSEDKTAPEIHFQENEITYTVKEGYEEAAAYAMLLEGVTAVDKRDGDVTQSLVVEGIYLNDDKTLATVVYVARDKANNIRKAKRVVKLQYDGIAMQEGQEDSQKSDTEQEPEKVPEVSATPTPEATPEATPEPENLPEGSPRIKLKKNRVTVQKGESLNRIALVESITDDKDGRDYLWNHISIEGDTFNSNTSGDYEQIYYVIDSDGNKSNEEKLIITVR